MILNDVVRLTYPSAYTHDGTVTLKIVLAVVTGERETARIGQGAVDWIAINGDPVSFKDAQRYFPHLLEERYQDDTNLLL